MKPHPAVSTGAALPCYTFSAPSSHTAPQTCLRIVPSPACGPFVLPYLPPGILQGSEPLWLLALPSFGFLPLSPQLYTSKAPQGLSDPLLIDKPTRLATILASFTRRSVHNGSDPGTLATAPLPWWSLYLSPMVLPPS